jgi:hypothetical protein
MKAIVKSLNTASANWATNTGAAAGKWKSAVDAAQGNYCANFGKFVGHPISQACANYAAGVGAVSATDFAQAVSGRQAAYTAGLQAVK